MTNEEIRERFLKRITHYEKTYKDESLSWDKRNGGGLGIYCLMSAFNEVFPELQPIEYHY